MTRWFAVLVLSGCSLSSIADLDLRECASDDDCAPLNAADGISDDACVLWQCNTVRSCELRARDDDDDGTSALACGGSDCDDSSAAARPGAPEICDGLDNDCNGDVDDVDVEPPLHTVVAGVPDPTWSFVVDSWVAYPSALGAAIDPLAGTTAPSPLGFAHAPAFSSAALAPGCETFVELEPRPPTAAPVGTSDETCQAHAECDDGVLCNGFEVCDPRSPDADELGCRSEGAPACPSSSACDEEAFVCRELSADVSCSVETLVAARSGGDRWFAAVINDVGCAAGEVRVGLLDPTSGTLEQRGDARRSAIWPTLEACAGATRPAIDSLPADAGRLRPQALLAWVADCHDAPCVAQPHVDLIGLWDEEATAGGEPIAWVHGTQRARLEAIAAGAVPSVVATEDGYLVVYPAPDGGMWVHRVEPLPDPAEVVPAEPHRTTIDPTGDPRVATPLELPDAVRVGSETMRELVVARGPDDRVGLAWSSADGTFFATLEGASRMNLERIGEPGVELALLGLERGVVGSMRADDTGGWIATWVREGRVWFRRIGLDGAAGRARSLGADPRLPRLHLDSSGTPRVLFHAGNRDELVSAGLCGLR